MSLVIDPTLTMAKTLLSNDSNFSAGNAPIALEYYCYEIEADKPWFNYHGPKIMISKQESPITICTAEYNWYYTQSKTLSSTSRLRNKHLYDCHRPWHYGRKHSLLNVMIR